MPKDTQEKIYLNPAIPRNSRLAHYLEESSARSGITKSQLLVWFATEYVRLIVDGQAHPAPPPAQVEPVTAQPVAKEEPQGSIRTLESINTGNDPNFDSFGDPD